MGANADYELLHPIADATATTTSDAQYIGDAEKVVFVFKRSNHSAGKTVFTVTVSVDGTNYITYVRLISNAANANDETITRVDEWDTGAANGTAFFTMSPEDSFAYCKVTATETTDGTHNAWIYKVLK